MGACFLRHQVSGWGRRDSLAEGYRLSVRNRPPHNPPLAHPYNWSADGSLQLHNCIVTSPARYAGLDDHWQNCTRTCANGTVPVKSPPTAHQCHSLCRFTLEGPDSQVSFSDFLQVYRATPSIPFTLTPVRCSDLMTTSLSIGSLHGT